MRALVAGLLTFVLALPVASALPEPVGDEEIVSAHSSWSWATQQSCSSYDPALGVVSTDLTSRLSHVPDGAFRTFTLHLDATADPACPAIDMVFTSDIAWGASSFAGSWWMPCGGSGSAYGGTDAGGAGLQIYFAALPAACGLPSLGTSTMLFIRTSNVVAGSQVCVPVVFPGCTGPREYAHPTHPECQNEDRFLAIDAVGFTLLYGAHRCGWMNGGEHGQVGDGFDVVRVRGTPESCEVTLLGSVGGEQSVACPSELGERIYAQDWHAIL